MTKLLVKQQQTAVKMNNTLCFAMSEPLNSCAAGDCKTNAGFCTGRGSGVISAGFCTERTVALAGFATGQYAMSTHGDRDIRCLLCQRDAASTSYYLVYLFSFDKNTYIILFSLFTSLLLSTHCLSDEDQKLKGQATKSTDSLSLDTSHKYLQVYLNHQTANNLSNPA
jgi:hypothetical protein